MDEDSSGFPWFLFEFTRVDRERCGDTGIKEAAPGIQTTLWEVHLLKETLVRRIKRVRGKAVDFVIDSVRLPNKKTAVREYLDHPGAVTVVPLIGPGRVVLVRQYRYPVGEITWELPAGKLDKGESPLACVKRELEEETGYTARSYKKILAFWPTAAFANEVIHVYVATGLTPGQINLDEDEFVTCAIWPLAKAHRAIRSGLIKDSKTIIGLLSVR